MFLSVPSSSAASSQSSRLTKHSLNTFVDQLGDGAGGDLGGCGGVDVIPDSVAVHAPAPARQPRHGEAL